jgi:hypothetical protein
MTEPNNKQFAKDVAKQLDRRRMRRKLVLLALLVAALVLAITYLTCGRGWGVGGAGKGEGSGPGSGSGTIARADAGPNRCSIRVTADGILVDGAPATREAAVATCKATSGADVVVTGDARQGDWDALRADLEAASVPIFTKQR